MTGAQTDSRTDRRKAEDERIASEPALQPLDVTTGNVPKPVEEHLRKLRRNPVAIIGVVENGVVRPLDPQITLPERSRVIIVASDLT
jgi:hypothetical protein